MPRVGIDLTAITFGYRKLTMIRFWNVRTLLNNGNGGPQDARFVQFEREFQQYKRDILGISGIRLWDSGEYSSPSWCEWQRTYALCKAKW